MQKQFLMGLAALGMVAVMTPSLAQEDNLCLDCRRLVISLLTASEYF